MTPNTAKARNTLPNEGGNALLGHILCVDDEKQILTSLMRVFRRSGHKVSIATSGTEGLELLANTPVDIVISDMRMSGMDGDA